VGAGFTYDPSPKPLVVRLAPDGQARYVKVLPGVREVAIGVAVDGQGTYLVGPKLEDCGPEVKVLRLDGAGRVLARAQFRVGGYDQPTDIASVPGGDLALTGTTGYPPRAFAALLGPDLVPRWVRVLEVRDWSYAVSIASDDLRGLAVVGTAGVHDASDTLLARFRADGLPQAIRLLDLAPQEAGVGVALDRSGMEVASGGTIAADGVVDGVVAAGLGPSLLGAPAGVAHLVHPDEAEPLCPDGPR
jgi:hypothetical protein